MKKYIYTCESWIVVMLIIYIGIGCGSGLEWELDVEGNHKNKELVHKILLKMFVLLLKLITCIYLLRTI